MRPISRFLTCAILLCFIACSDNSDKQADTDSADNSPSDADSDSDGDTDIDTDTDSYSDEIPCNGEYPPGPYGWDLDNTLPAVSFPGMYGSDGEVDKLDMCEVYKNRAQVKSLVFSLGAKG